MATEKQIEAARINGAMSHGPVTPEGKAVSSQNARKHGYSSPNFIHDTEDAEAFAELLAGYRACYTPSDRAEDDFVNDMAVYRFRLEQVRSKRASAADMEAARQEKLLLGEVQKLDDEAIAARVIVTQNANGEFDAFARYESHFDRLFNRAFRSLLALQKHRASHPRRQLAILPEPEPSGTTNTALQNEPQQPAKHERLYSIDQMIEGGHIPSLRETNRRTPPRAPEREPEREESDVAA